jgi:DNA polymerase-3 subunit beta
LDSDRLQFSAKLIEGNYPDWRRVLPDESTYTPVVVDAKTLIGAVARLSVVASQNAKGLKTPLRLSIIKMNDAVDELELAVGEEGREMLELAEFKDAIDFEIGLNIDYLEDALKPVDTEKLTLGLRDQNSSLVVRYKEDQVSILMPLRI